MAQHFRRYVSYWRKLTPRRRSTRRVCANPRGQAFHLRARPTAAAEGRPSTNAAWQSDAAVEDQVLNRLLARIAEAGPKPQPEALLMLLAAIAIV
jgi:hypothetical protein